MKNYKNYFEFPTIVSSFLRMLNYCLNWPGTKLSRQNFKFFHALKARTKL